MKRITAPFVLMVMAMLGTTPAAAEDDAVPPVNRLVYSNITAARNNPIGLMNIIEVTYKRRLFEPDGMLLDDTHLSVGPFFDLNPSAAALGGTVRFKPLAILQLSASHAWVGYFGTFGLLQSFDTANIDYSDTQRGLNSDAGLNYATTGHTTKLEGLLQAKVGPIAVRSSFLASHSAQQTKGQPYWFDTGLDVLAASSGWVLKNDADLLWVSDMGLIAGTRWTWTNPLLETDTHADQSTHRVGPVALYTFFDRPGARFNAPTIALMAQWYVRHPYRTGQDVHAALPYIAGAMIFKGDLLPW